MDDNFKLEPEHKKLWLAALRSGNYKQGVGKLFIPYSRSLNTLAFTDLGLDLDLDEEKSQYCCLGVAYRAISGHIPASVCYLSHHDPFYIPTKLQYAFSLVNDGATLFDIVEAFHTAGFNSWPESTHHVGTIKYRSDFNQIADWIEKNL